MRPLLLHASSPATAPAHRRVVHLEFAPAPLSGGLEWHWSIGRSPRPDGGPAQRDFLPATYQD